MTPETKLKNKVQKYLKSLGADCWFFKVAGGPHQRPGIPDVVGCYKGKFFAMENKAEDGVISDKQAHEIEKIVKSRGRVQVIQSLQEAIEFMESM